jgi:hypothetical protein
MRTSNGAEFAGDAELRASQMHRTAVGPVRQAEKEYLRRVDQRSVPGRVRARALARLARSNSNRDRGLTTEIQRRATEEVGGQAIFPKSQLNLAGHWRPRITQSQWPPVRLQ